MEPNARRGVPRDNNQDFIKWIKSFPVEARKERLVKIVSGGVLRGTSAKAALRKLQQSTSVPLTRLNFTQGLINQAQEYREEARMGVPAARAQPAVPVERPEKTAKADASPSSSKVEPALVSSQAGGVGTAVQKPCPLSRKRKLSTDDGEIKELEFKPKRPRQPAEVLTVVEILEPTNAKEPELVNLASPEDSAPQEDQPVPKEDLPVQKEVHPSVPKDAPSTGEEAPSLAKEAPPVAEEAPPVSREATSVSKENASFKRSPEDLASKDTLGSTANDIEGNATVLPPSHPKGPAQSMYPEGTSSTPKSVAAPSDRLVSTSRQLPAPSVNASNVPKTAKIMVALSEHIVNSMMQEMATAIYDTEVELLKLNERLSLLERELPPLRHEKVMYALREACEVLKMKSARIKNCVENGVVDQLQRRFYPTLLREIQRDPRRRLYTSMRLVTIVNMLLSVARPNAEIKNVLNSYISAIIVEQNQRKSDTLDARKESTVLNNKLPSQEARSVLPQAPTLPQMPVLGFPGSKPTHVEPSKRVVSSEPNQVPQTSYVAPISQPPAAAFNRSTAQPRTARLQQVPPPASQGAVMPTTVPVPSQPLSNYAPSSQVAPTAQASSGALNFPQAWSYPGSAQSQPSNNVSHLPSSAVRNASQAPSTVNHFPHPYAQVAPGGQPVLRGYLSQGGVQPPAPQLPQNFVQTQAYMGQVTHGQVTHGQAMGEYSSTVVRQQIQISGSVNVTPAGMVPQQQNPLTFPPTAPQYFGGQPQVPDHYLQFQNTQAQVAVQQSTMLALQAQQVRNNQQAQAYPPVQMQRQASYNQVPPMPRSHPQPQFNPGAAMAGQAQQHQYASGYQSNVGSLGAYQQQTVVQQPISREQPAKVPRQYSASGGLVAQHSYSSQAPMQQQQQPNITFANKAGAYDFLNQTTNPEGHSTFEQSSAVKIVRQVSPVARACSRDSGISTPEPPQYDETQRVWPRRSS